MKTKNLLKKAFLLLALMGGASSAWGAETTIVSFAGGEWTGGTATYTTNGTLESNKLKFASSDGTGTEGTRHIQVVLSSGTFQTGDAISITYYASNTSKSVTPGFFFGTISGETFTITGSIQADATSAGSSSPATQTNLTVPEDANGSNVLRLTRYTGGTALYITAISITRSTASEAYTVSFNAGSNGTYTGGDIAEASAGAGITLPALTTLADGYVFNGWYTAASEGTKVGDAGDKYNPEANVTLYAQYSAETAPGISIDNYNPSTTCSKAITFTATPTGAPAPTVTWYQSATATTSGGTEKGTGLTYNPDVADEGTYYYYAVASNGVSPNATSGLITLTVTNPDIVRTGYNTYYLAKDDQPVGGSSVLCDNITMVYDNVTLGTAGKDEMIKSLNSNYVSSVSCSTNGWGVSFTPTADGVLSVGVIANKDKYIEITNVSSFDYIDKDGNSGTYSGTTSNKLAAKFYGIVTFNVVSGTTYKVSVTGGSKMGLYGFEFAPSVSLNASGYATYSNAFAVEVSGAKAYTAELDFANETITCTEIASNKIPAGNGVLLYGEPDATVTLTPTTGASALGTNNLKATTLADGSLATKGANNYYALSGDTFMEYTGAAFVHNKAYFEVNSGTVLARSMRIVFADVTGINEAQATTEAVAKEGKFFKDGKLVIFKNGKKYNAAGAQVK